MMLDNDLAAGQARAVSESDYQPPRLSPRAREHRQERDAKAPSPLSKAHIHQMNRSTESLWLRDRQSVYSQLLKIDRPVLSGEMAKLLPDVNSKHGRMGKILYDLKRRGLAQRSGQAWEPLRPDNVAHRMGARVMKVFMAVNSPEPATTPAATTPAPVSTTLETELAGLRAYTARPDDSALATLHAVIQFMEETARPGIAGELRKFLPAEAPCD